MRFQFTAFAALQTALLSAQTVRAVATAVGSYTDVNNMPVTAVGCYVDSSSNRLLNKVPAAGLNASAMTVQACALGCSKNNYRISGVEFGSECYCAETLPSGLVTATTCAKPCSGSVNDICGDANAISVYSQQLLSETATANITYKSLAYQGCYAVPTGSGFIVATSSSNTIEQCGDLCASGGYGFMGLSGTSCFCSTTAFSSVGSTSSCTTVCPGNNLELCGITSTFITAYSTGSTGVPEISAHIAGYTSVSGSAFTYAGCYHDSVSSRVLTKKLSLVSTTPQLCMDACSAAGYAVAAVEFGAECWCGNAYDTATLWTSAAGSWTNLASSNLDVHCTMPCNGASSVACGGPDALQLYFTSTFSGFLDSGFTDYKGDVVTFSGCFKDNSTNALSRTFAVRDYSITDGMTAQKCALACLTNPTVPGATYSGLEYGSECWCSLTAPSSGLALPTASCMDMRCSGASDQWCAGGDKLAVYHTTLPSSASAVGSYKNVVYVGCKADSSGARVVNQYYTTTTSVESCVSTCAKLGFVNAGLSNGNGCFCSSTLGTLTTSTNCNVACAGASSQLCGGANAVSLYQTGTTLPVILSSTVSTDISTISDNHFSTTKTTNSHYIGCVVDADLANRVLPVRASLSNPTPATCLDACTTLGYNYAGLEYGGECWCGLTLSSPTLDEGSCSMPCASGSPYACGSGFRLSAYSNGGSSVVTHPSTSGTYTLSGCYGDSMSSRTLRYQLDITFNTMTPDVCTTACKAAGFAYAGVEWAGQCFCDTDLTASTISDSSCMTPCAGAPTQYCGGDNAINIYHDATISRSVPTSYTATGNVVWNFKACWHEPNNARGLPTFIDNVGGTIDSCLELGAAQNFNACGLEYGGECWCSNITNDPLGYQIPMHYCLADAMPCRLNTQQMCGSGNLFAFFSTGSQTYSTI